LLSFAIRTIAYFGSKRISKQARNFAMHSDEHNMPRKMVMRDNDKKYPKTFDDVFTTPTCRIKRNVPASPNLQAYVERVIQTLKHEVLNGFCVVVSVR
jgi:putative transposase